MKQPKSSLDTEKNIKYLPDKLPNKESITDKERLSAFIYHGRQKTFRKYVREANKSGLADTLRIKARPIFKYT